MPLVPYESRERRNLRRVFNRRAFGTPPSFRTDEQGAIRGPGQDRPVSVPQGPFTPREFDREEVRERTMPTVDVVTTEEGRGPFERFAAGAFETARGAVRETGRALGTTAESANLTPENLTPVLEEAMRTPTGRNVSLLDSFLIRPAGALLSTVERQAADSILAAVQGKVAEDRIAKAAQAFANVDIEDDPDLSPSENLQRRFDARLDAFTDELDLLPGQQLANEILAGAFVDPLLPAGPLRKFEQLASNRLRAAGANVEDAARALGRETADILSEETGAVGRRRGVTGERLLPDLSTPQGIRAEMQHLDVQIRAARRRRESAGPALQTTERQSAGIGPGVTVESLEAERAQLDDLLQQTLRREEATEVFGQAPQEARPRMQRRPAPEAAGETPTPPGAGVSPRTPQPLPSGRVPGGPRATPRPAMTPRGPGQLPPPPEGGLPSGRMPGGPERQVPSPERNPLEQVREALTPTDEPLIRRVIDGLEQGFYDRNFPLKALQEQTGIPVRDLAQVVPGAQTAGENIIRRFYQPIVQRVQKDADKLQEYMTLKRMEDIIARNPSARLPGNLDGINDVFRAQRTLRSEIGDARYAELERAARELWDLNDQQVLKPMRDEGIISSEQYVAMKSSHPHYIPFQRADFVDNVSQAFTRPEASVSTTGIRQMGIEGSDRALDNPLNRLLAEPLKSRGVIFRNRAARSIVEALEEMQRKTGEDLVRVVTDSAEHSRLTDTISFFREGRKVTVQVPAEFARVAKDLAAEPDGIALQVVRAINAPLRRGATEFNPAFIPVNVMLDAMSAMFRENIFPFGPDWWAGLVAAFRKNALFDEAAEHGALMSGIVENMRAPRNLTKARLGGIQVKSPADALLLIPRLISESNVLFERATRLAAYRKLRNEGVSQLEAARRTRDVSVDFAKSGHSMRVINQIIPFSNAALQGSANIARTVRDHPVRSAAYAGLFSSATAMTRVNNMRFETSKDIPDYEYTRNWVVQMGEGERKDGSKFPIYIKLPKGEIAGLFSFPTEAVFNWARDGEDRSAVELVLTEGFELGTALSPVDVFQGVRPAEGAESIPEAVGTGILSAFPPIVQTGAGVAGNTNTFTGAPIVPQREQRLLPEQQFGPETSVVAVGLGQRFGISPRLIQFAIEDYTAGAGQVSNWLVGMGLEAAGFDPKEFGSAVAEAPPEGVEAASQAPGVRRFLGTRDTQSTRRGFDVFNSAVKETQREFAAIPGMNELGISLGEAQARGEIEMTPQQLAEYQRILAEVTVPAMTEEMTRIEGLPEEQQRGHVRDSLRILRDIAWERAFREIIAPALAPQAPQRPRSRGEAPVPVQRPRSRGDRTQSRGEPTSANPGRSRGFDLEFDDEGVPRGLVRTG